jgi:hypothetical protein
MVLLLTGMEWAGFDATALQRAQQTTQEPATTPVIWTGESGGFIVTWTTADIQAVRAERPSQTIFSVTPLAQQGFDAFAALLKESDSADESQHCTYERQFRLMSVVGSLLGLEDEVYTFCEGWAHPAVETRFTAIDLAKPGQTAYASAAGLPPVDVDLARLGNIATLTEFFPEPAIRRALLADAILKQMWQALGNPPPPSTLSEIPQVLADRSVEVGNCLFRFPADFLTRFVVHHVARGRVAVRIGLPPNAGACRTQHAQLGILLAVPDALQKPFRLASSGQAGFLLREQAKIAGKRATTVAFGTGKFAPQ